MTSCVAYGCTNRSIKKIPGITFHNFLKDEKRRALWILAVRRKNWNPSIRSKLCSKHFSEDQFDRTSLCYVRLKENAVPVIFDAFPSYLKPDTKPARKMPKIRNEWSSNLPMPQSNQASSTIPDPSMSEPMAEPSTSSLDTSNTISISQSVNSNSSTEENLKRKINCLEEKLEKKNKDIKLLQQKARRYQNKVISLKSVLSELIKNV